MSPRETHLHLLDLSIEHWRENHRAGVWGEVRRGASDCALCNVYNNVNTLSSRCDGCPVALRTGQILCHGSPYEAVHERASVVLAGTEGPERGLTPLTDADRRLIQDEIDFLVRLREDIASGLAGDELRSEELLLEGRRDIEQAAHPTLAEIRRGAYPTTVDLERITRVREILDTEQTTAQAWLRSMQEGREAAVEAERAEAQAGHGDAQETGASWLPGAGVARRVCRVLAEAAGLLLGLTAGLLSGLLILLISSPLPAAVEDTLLVVLLAVCGVAVGWILRDQR